MASRRPPGRALGGGYGYWLPGFDNGYRGDDYAYEATPRIVVVPQTIEPPTPPRLVRGEVRDYTKTNPPEPAEGPPAEFTIVGTDHLGHPAVAVWEQDGLLHYLNADGVAGKMPLSAVDRDATRQANAAKGLQLHLPAE
ncbi:MAG: hypothetical protein ABSH46_04835 [Bryobacteraceae bacterium]|jgi:hypothetical protein